MNFYQQPYPFVPQVPNYQFVPSPQFDPLFQEQSYIENILRLNIGKVCTVYMNFEDSQWGSKIFKGVLKAAGKDHIVLKDLQSETVFLLLSIYLSYVTFDESIEYQYPFRKKEIASR